MSLPAGAKIGPYEIVALLGAGGMGEVYRGRDSRLSRDVALKILLPNFAADADRMARFQREAQVLASLNHPHIASIYGLRGSPSTPEYAAAKHAIVGLTRSTALEVAPLGIHVNAVAPGFIDTPLLSPIQGQLVEFLKLQIPSGRLGQPEEVAELVRFLAGPESSYCYGEILTLTGGY